MTFGIAVAYALGTMAGLAVQRLGGQPVIWIASSILASGLLILPRGGRLACTLIAWTLASLTYLGEPLGTKAGFFYNLICVGEAWTLALLCDRFMPNIRLSTPRSLLRLMLVAVAPASLLAAVANATANTLLWPSVHFSTAFWQALPAKALGMSVVMPSLLVLLGAKRPLRSNFRPLEQGMVFLAAIVLAVVPMILWQYPEILVIFPALVFVAFRYGTRMAVISALIINAITIVSSAYIWSLDPAHQLAGVWNPQLQQTVAAVFFTGIVTGMVTEQQQRLRSMLLRRTDIAYAERRRAIQASQAKTDFLATMSHEIRTPMNSILGFSQLLLRRSDLPSDAVSHLSMIERSGGALLTIVDDILDFSKVEAGQVQLSPRLANIAVVAEDCLAIIGQFAREKDLTLSINYTGDVRASHLVDDQRLRQVLLNLLNNAVKFTSIGAVRLEVEVAEGQHVDRLRFAVMDTGAGIDPENLDRLFRRFSQVDGSVTRDYGGTGLGLAICKGLVEIMGGKIGVESELGGGSTFWFELDLPHAAAAEAVEGAPDDEEALLCAHILLVDDHPVNRELGSAILKMLGCTVDLAEDGEQAIAAVRAGRYDAILMDVHMPKMDGLDATRAIRKLDGHAGATPIIAMSADVLPEQMDRCRAAGMVDSVGKPIRIETLHAVLQRWIGFGADGHARAA